MQYHGEQQSAIHPFGGWDLSVLLNQQAEIRASHPFLIWEPFATARKTWTYKDFVSETQMLAAGMAARGISAGDTVLIHLENCPEFLLSWCACATLGAVAVTTNTRSAGPELSYYAETAKVQAAITQPKFASLVAASCPDISWLSVTSTDAGIEASTYVPEDQRFDALFLAEQPPARSADPTAPLCIMFTSGTTSRPKGVVWTHGNGLWAARSSAFHEGLTSTDIHLVCLPLFHMNAISCQFLATLWVGGTIVLQPRFSASRFWDVATRNKCTWGSIVPFCANALKDKEVPEHHFRAWGVGVNGIYDKRFRLRSLGWWGMTETVTVGIVGSVHHNDSPFTLGRPSPLYQIAVLTDEGSLVDPGETGELRIKGIPGISLFDHYLNNPQATSESFDEQGFFKTGDRVKRNLDGTLTFADRLKDMLKVGGENVSASEIERVIQSVPAVLEVAVVGKPHNMLNEVPVAFVLADPSRQESALIDQVTRVCATELADFKQPHEVRVVDELPRANLEKIAKAKLRDLLREQGQER